MAMVVEAHGEDLDPTLANNKEDTLEEDNLLVDTQATPTHGENQMEVAHGDKVEVPEEGLDMDQEETQVVIPGDKVQIMDGLQIVKDVEETLVDGEEELLDGELHPPTVKVSHPSSPNFLSFLFPTPTSTCLPRFFSCPLV